MPSPKIIVVTGANRGIGHAICSLILSRPDLGPLKLFATSRNGNFSLPNEQHQDREILYPRLDISNHDSIRALRDEVSQHGKVSVLINNAGINLDNKYSPDNAKKTLDVNFRGTVKMCQSFIPHMAPQGRIVNLASVASSIQYYSPAIQERFRQAASLDDLEKLAHDFESSTHSHTEQTSGFGPPARSYSVSKALLRAFTVQLAAAADPSSSLLINSCCPGWISTDMGALVGTTTTRPPKSPEQGAQIPLRLAFDDIDGITGKYWANDSVRSKESGRVQTEW